MSLEELKAAGLYEPDAPDVTQRRELFEYLSEQGITAAEMIEAYSSGRIISLAAERAVRPGERLTAAELASRAGVDVDFVRRIWRAWGFPAPAPDDARFSDADIETMGLMKLLAELIGPEPVMHTARTIGSAVARVAEAEPGGVVVSTAVRTRVRGVTDAFEFTALPPRVLAGYDRPPTLYGLTRPPDPS